MGEAILPISPIVRSRESTRESEVVFDSCYMRRIRNDCFPSV